MNKEQKNQLLDSCKKFTVENLIASGKKHYGDKNWEEDVVGAYTINEFIHIVTKAFKQLQNGLLGEDYAVYPLTYFLHGIGESNIQIEINRILEGVEKAAPFNEFSAPLNWVSKYLVELSLWNKERAEIDISDLEEKHTKILIITENARHELSKIEREKQNYIDERNHLYKEVEVLKQLIEQKKQELQIVADAVPTVTNSKAEVDLILKTVQQTDSETRAIQKNHSELYEQLKSQKDNQEKEYKELSGKISDDTIKLGDTIDTGYKQIAFFKSLDDFIKEKQSEIIELGALAAGAALGGTFGLRQKSLNDSIRKFWRWAVPIITVVAMTWVIIAFTYLKSLTGNIYIDIILNLAKTIPAFVLMGFVFKQYNKERNLEEEYAFKAAVANTIKAYSDLLKGEDNEVNKSRQTMLNDSVKQVQNPPKLYIERSGRIFSFSTKGLSETIKNLNETIKTMKK